MGSSAHRERLFGSLVKVSGKTAEWIASIAEISARRQRELEVRKSRSQLVDAQRIAQLGSWEWDLVTGRISWSEELYRVLGIDEPAPAPDYDVFMGFIPPEEREAMRKTLEAAVTRGVPFSTDHHVVRTDGAVRTFHARGRLERDERGRPARLVGTCQDITELRALEEERARLRAESAAHEEIEQLFRLTQELGAASSLGELYELAANGIERVLGIRRFSILLFDAGGVMRFVSSRGLSEAYRSAVEGHSPWQVGARAPQPLLVPDARDDASLAELRSVLDAEQIRALAFIPLVTRGALIGKLMIYYREPRRFSPHEIDIVQTVAGHVASAVARKQAEDALAHERKLFRTVLEQMPSAVLVAEAPSGKLLLANDQNQAIFRTPIAAGSVAEYAHRLAVRADGRPFDEAEWPLARAVQRGEIVRGEEVRIVRDDGSEATIRISAAPIRDDRDRIVAGVVTYDDVTAARRAIEDLRTSEARLQAILETGTAAVSLKDLAGRYITVNRELERITGVSRERLVGHTHAEVFGEESAAEVAAEEREALVTNGPVHFEHELVRGGERRFLLTVRFPLHDASGRVYGVGAISTDVTPVKRAQSILAGQKLALERIAEGAPLAAVLEILARSAEEASSAGVRPAILLLDDEGTHLGLGAAPGLPEAYRRTLDALPVGPSAPVYGRAAHLGAEIIVTDIGAEPARRRDPALAQGIRAVWATPIFSTHGAVRGVFALHFDEARGPTTEERQLVETLTRTASIALENVRVEEALRQADRRKDEFLALLGHELRNPLAPILTALELMKLRGRGLERERAVIERQVRHMVQLVDDLLDISRITRGKIQLRRARVEVSQAVAEAVEIASPLLEQRSHNLSLDVDGERLVVDGDPVRLAQIFANLLTNAAKYTEPGGHIEVRIAPRGDGFVSVRVRDDGIGIAPEMLANIFEPFVQAARTSERAPGGLGLGLPLVHSLVRLHGGEVVARSEGVGKGSEFEVVLPLVAGMPIEAPRGSDSSVELGAAAVVRRVLVVDDNVDAAELLADALRARGHVVAVAHDGPEALRVVPSFHPDTAILDIGLPVMDGYELGRRLADRDMRLIAVTGYGQDTDRRRSRSAGFDVHLVKPVDLDVVLGEVERTAEDTRRPDARVGLTTRDR
jgi:PAS domain S-box-containing protein